MKRLTTRIRTWLCVALASLGLHYLMMLLAHLVLNGGFSWPFFCQMLVERLTTPGDAPRYLNIAENGYAAAGENAINLVFYPLYPLLIRAFGYITGDLPLAGVIVSQISYGIASILLYELILLDGDSRQAWDGVLLMALYPFSMFVMGVFSEGLFLALTLGALYALRRGWFGWAGAVGFLAALTRTQGMLLFFPAVYQFIRLRFGPERRRGKISDGLLLLIPAGFGVYLLLNWLLHGNAFQFLQYEADEPWYQTTKWLGENIAQQYGQALEYGQLSLIIYWAQLALYFLVLAVLFLGVRRKTPTMYLLYGGVYLGFTYLSGWMISGGRYMLCCVPVYIILSNMKDGMGRKLLIAGEALLFFAYSLFYLRGFAIM